MVPARLACVQTHACAHHDRFGAAPMADESVVASIIPWQQPKTAKPRPKRTPVVKPRPRPKPKKTKAALDDEMLASETLIMPDFLDYVNEPSRTPGVADPSRTEAAASAAAAAIPATAVPRAIAPRDGAPALDGEIVPPSVAPAPRRAERLGLSASSIL